MKRIRITAALMVSAALLTLSVGAQAASDDGSAQVAVVLPAQVCGSLYQPLIDSDVIGHDIAGVTITFEIVGPAPRWDPVSAWLPIGQPDVSLFRCDGPRPGAISSDVATAP